MALSVLPGCLPPMGPSNLLRDKIAYDKAIKQGSQEELLLNIVQLRFADTPVFLETQQIIGNYNYKKRLIGGIAGSPWGGVPEAEYNGLGMAGELAFADNPTITYQPLSGDHMSALILHPLSPNVVVPLIQGSPIDMLLSLVAESLGGEENIRNPVSAGPMAYQSAENFTLLVQDLRKLQIEGAISVRHILGAAATKNLPAVPARTYLVFENGGEESITKLQNETKKLLDLPQNVKEAEIVYDRKPTGKAQIVLTTRSMLSILTNISATIEVSPESIKEGKTVPTISDNVRKGRSTIVVHCDHEKSKKDVFVEIHYKDHTYWISDSDFESKLAFTLLQIICTLAMNRTAEGAMVTIPVSGGH
ncbi:hypothetical protein RF55_14324 [Lasius niger]|uniref:Uncharacterized protein n=1 Tax=Lasius niger TaxID=67767 RepID=A0A0J7K8W6_LASNI|nr:hypothetical protein RF55_14324 [Lasius niger]